MERKVEEKVLWQDQRIRSRKEKQKNVKMGEERGFPTQRRIEQVNLLNRHLRSRKGNL